MLGVDIEKKLLKELEESTCFGIAHDETVPECKQCDVRAQCKARTEGADIPTPNGRVAPTPKASATPATTTEKAPKPKSSTGAKKSTSSTTATGKSPSKPKANKATTDNSNYPDFKAMTNDELSELASERGVEVKDYGNESINRMRMIMALKKSY